MWAIHWSNYLVVEEERVVAPGEWLSPHVQVFILGGLGEHTIVIMPQVLEMLKVLLLEVVYPGTANSN